MFEVRTPTWCIVTFAPGVFVDDEFTVCAPPALYGNYIAFGYAYDPSDGKNKWLVYQDGRERWKLDLHFLSLNNRE